MFGHRRSLGGGEGAIRDAPITDHRSATGLVGGRTSSDQLQVGNIVGGRTVVSHGPASEGWQVMEKRVLVFVRPPFSFTGNDRRPSITHFALVEGSSRRSASGITANHGPARGARENASSTAGTLTLASERPKPSPFNNPLYKVSFLVRASVRRWHVRNTKISRLGQDRQLTPLAMSLRSKPLRWSVSLSFCTTSHATQGVFPF